MEASRKLFLPARGCQPVPLCRAARGIRLGALHQAGVQRRLKIALPESGGVPQPQCPHQLRRTSFVTPQRFHKAAHLVGYLYAYLIGEHTRQSITQRLKHEFNKPRRFALRVSLSQTRAVLGLTVTDDGFYRHVGQNGLPFAQDERLPEASHAAVAVMKGVYELKFVVKHAACDEGVFVRILQPLEQIFEVSAHQAGGWGHVNKFPALKYAHAAGAEFSGLLHQIMHKQGMG